MEPLPSGHEPHSDAAATGANAALSARVTALLPAEWREGVRVAVVPGGFVAALRDAAGVEHALRADWQEAGFHALAHGRRFCLSYLARADGPEDAAELARFHEAAHTLLADEDPLAALTRAADGAPPPVDAAPGAPPGFDLAALPAAGEALAAWVTARLPEGWREGARVALAPGGFAAGARDASGRWRVVRARELEPGFAGLAQGRHFDFSNLARDGEPEDAAAVAQYRALAEALRAQEDQIADDLQAQPERRAEDVRAAAEQRARALEPAPPPTEAPPVVIEAPPPGFDASSLPAATAALSTRVTALLPAGWRAGARVARTPGGFVVESRDAAVALRADWQETGFHALAHGRRFCLSYLGLADAAALAHFHEAAQALLADEAALAGFTRATGASDPLKAGEVPAGPGFDLAAWPSAGDGLAAWVTARLPEGWREGARVALAPGGFAAGARDASGRWWVVRARELEPGFAGLAQGRHFDFSNLARDGEPEDAAAVAQYRALAEALRAQEDALAEDLYPSGFGGARVGLDLLAQPSPGEQLSARVRALLPADWREDVRVARAYGGFAVGFRDASGARHVLRAQWIEEGFAALAYGRRFGLFAQESAGGTAGARTLAETLLEREEDLAEALRSTRRIRGYDPFATPPPIAALTAWLDALPPAPWRQDARAVRTHDGFAVRFRDAAGALSVLRAQWLEEEFPVVAHGHRVSVAYLRSPGEPEGPGRRARYGEVAAAFVAQEVSLAREARPHDAAGRPLDLFGAPPMNVAIAARALALLPADWRDDVKAAPVHNGFVVGFGDAAGGRHVLFGEWLEEGAQAFVLGRHFSFSYASGAAPDDAATVARYREVLLALAAQEDGVAADLRAG